MELSVPRYIPPPPNYRRIVGFGLVEAMFRYAAPSRARRLLSWGCRTLWSVMCDVLALRWIERPLPGLLELPPAAFEVFGSSPSTRISRCALHPPMSFGPPAEYDETSPPPASRRTAPPMRFPASSRHGRLGSAVTVGSMPPPPSALRFSQPLGGLLPDALRGLVSSRWHVQASLFRGFPS